MTENTNITLNLQSPNIAVVTYAVQGDQSARRLTAQLVDGSLPWTAPNNSTAVVRYMKPDGTVGFYDTDDNDNPAISINGSVATVTLVEQAVSVPGDVFMQLNFYATDNTRVSSFAWILRVQESVFRDQQIVSSDYFNVLTQAIANGAAVAQQLTFPVPIANGGTGAETAAGARENLGLGNANAEFKETGIFLDTVNNLTTLYNGMQNGSYGVARIASNSTDAPTTGGGVVFTFRSSANYGAQQTLSDSGVYYRKLSGGTWSEWSRIV